MNTLLRSLLHLSAALVAIICSVFSQAGNVDFLPPADALARIDPMSPSCGTLAFVDDRLTITTPNDPFALIIDGEQFTLEGRSEVDVRVDPYSGSVIDGSGDEYYQYAVSADSGTLVFFGSSTALGIPSETVLLAGRVVGLDFETSPFVAGYNIMVDLEFVHPDIEAEVGPLRSIQYTYGTSIWIIPGVTDIPWQSEEPADINGCFTSSPSLELFSTPLDTVEPITFALSGEFDDPSLCALIGPDDLKDYEISYTFDARTPDEHPDPDIGLYVSCDDTYGSSAGSEIHVVDTQWQTSCVKIKVENNIVSVIPGIIFDRYTVEVGGREDITGTILRVLDFDAVMFSNDSLPVTPPVYDSGAGSTDVVSTSVDIASYCVIGDSDGELRQIGDADADGVADSLDNCVLAANSRQRDSDGDLYGNACDPDFNNDQIVNVLDLGMLRDAFFASGNLAFDLNSDGIVNIIDLGVTRELFFQPPGPSGLASVPD